MALMIDLAWEKRFKAQQEIAVVIMMYLVQFASQTFNQSKTAN